MSAPNGQPLGPIPIPPEAILDAMRNAEARLTEASADIRALRLALMAGEGRAAQNAANRLSGEGNLDAPAPPPLSGTLDVRSDVKGNTHDVPSGTAEGQFGWEGSATGTAPAEVTSWLETTKRYAPIVARVVETIVRVWTSAT